MIIAREGASFGNYPQGEDPTTCLMCDYQTDCMSLTTKEVAEA